jgi:putative DNA primase/helicase
MISTPNPRQNLKDGDKITVKIPKGQSLNGIKGQAPMNVVSPSHKAVLAELLDKVQPVEFRELAEMGEGDKLLKKHYLILVIEQIKELAEKNSWGLCKSDDFVYLYNGAYWCQLAPEELQAFLGAAAEKMAVDRFDARHYDFREKLYKQFLALAYLPKPEPPKDKVLINLLNGTLEITPDGPKLREHRREDFLTHQLPFAYDPNADAPIFRRYLDRVLPDPERQRVVAEFLGYVFIKPSYLKLEKALILYGSGANGKSVLFEVVEALLGKELLPAPADRPGRIFTGANSRQVAQLCVRNKRRFGVFQIQSPGQRRTH